VAAKPTVVGLLHGAPAYGGDVVKRKRQVTHVVSVGVVVPAPAPETSLTLPIKSSHSAFNIEEYISHP
jgi:hypothetical protein